MRTEVAAVQATERRNDALLEYYPMVRRIAHRAAATYGLPVGVEAGDLVSSGIIGLAQAWERFDAGRGVPFESYAIPRVKGAIIDAIRASDWIPRKARQKSARTGEPVLKLVSLEGGRVNDDSESHGDRIHDDTAPIPGVELLAGEQRREMLSVLNRLPEREKSIVTLFYFHGVKLATIAEEFGVTQSRISQIHGRALRMLREGLEAADSPDVA
jgi:RNA polymerase sigma factor for flagellar operon FliA